MLQFTTHLHFRKTVSRVAQSALSASLVALVCLSTSPAGAQTVLSSGYSLPETISQAPDSFGSYGGDLFIPDPVTNFAPGPHIWEVSPAGGSPTSFASPSDFHPLGGLFLPSTFGNLGGDYLATGINSAATTAEVFAYNSAGVGTEVASKSGGYYAVSALAPEGFGTLGGDVIIADEREGLDVLAPDHALSTFVSSTSLNSFGLTFAPAGFGPFAGDLLVSSTASGTIDAVNAEGEVSTFATLPLPPTGPAGQPGLRQMAFAPEGFLPSKSGPLLFVSVSGSQAGGGTQGDVYAVDSSGNVVYDLQKDKLNRPAFDPRGLYFQGTSDLLVSDASDPILALPPSAFIPFVSSAPEPSAVADCGVVALIAAGLVLKARKRRAA